MQIGTRETRITQNCEITHPRSARLIKVLPRLSLPPSPTFVFSNIANIPSDTPTPRLSLPIKAPYPFPLRSNFSPDGFQFLSP